MGHYARVENNIVTKVIVADEDFIMSGAVGDPSFWIQTSYNTRGGVHLNGGIPLRKNYAGIGFTYDKFKDAFIPPSPFPSWVLNTESCLWEPPMPMPVVAGKFYQWDEPTTSWIESEQ